MQHNAYTHSGATIGIGGNVNANDFPNSHNSNNSHVISAMQTSFQQDYCNSSSNSSPTKVSTALTETMAIAPRNMAAISSTNGETGSMSPNDFNGNGTTTTGGVANAVNYGATFFGNEYHHQLTSNYAAASTAAASTAMLTNYCDAAMMMAAAAVNVNQCLQQQQQRIALMSNSQNAHMNSGNSAEQELQILAKDTPPLNTESLSQNHHNNLNSLASTSLVSNALSSVSSTTSTTSSSASLLSSSTNTSPSITLVNTASLTSTNVNTVATAAELAQRHVQHLHQQQQNHHIHSHHHDLHKHEEPESSPNFIDISEVPLIVDVK